MKRPPETIEILLSLLTETTNIRDRELLYHTLPEEEQTPAHPAHPRKARSWHRQIAHCWPVFEGNRESVRRGRTEKARR